jgi:hypothetical protein
MAYANAVANAVANEVAVIAYVDAATLDKSALDIQALIDHKKKLIKTTYTDLLENVKDNPYLKTPIKQYEVRFEKEHKRLQTQIDLLKKTMLSVEPADQHEFVREIKYLEKQLLL